MREKNKKWMSSDEFKEKSKKSLIEKFGVDSYSKTIEFRKMISEFNISNRDYLREKPLGQNPLGKALLMTFFPYTAYPPSTLPHLLVAKGDVGKGV